MWADLWGWHNEHRIFFTRSLDLSLFLINEQQWDGRVQTFVSSALFSFICSMSAFWVLRNTRGVVLYILLTFSIASGIQLSGWANTYVGFQSCFYFVLLFSLVAIAASASVAPSWRGGTLVALSALAAVFSLAAGVLTTITVVAILALRIWIDRIAWRDGLSMIGLPAIVMIWSLLDARSGTVHPTTIGEFVYSLTIMMSWPFSSFAGTLLWSPVGVLVFVVVKNRRGSRADLVFLGLASWVFLFCCAAAYSRGYNFSDVQSRYTDLLLPGLGAQLYSLFRLCDILVTSAWVKRIMLGLSVGFTVIIAAGLWKSSVSELSLWKNYAYSIRMATVNTRAFLDGNIHALTSPSNGFLLYPYPSVLAEILNDSAVRSVLPVSLQSSVNTTFGLPRHCFWRPSEDRTIPVLGRIACGYRATASGSTAFTIGPLSALSFSAWQLLARQPYIRFDRVARKTNGKLNVGSCAIDQVNGRTPTVGSNMEYATVLEFSGWMGPITTDGDHHLLDFILEGSEGEQFIAKGVGGINRPDVAIFMQDVRYSNSGYSQRLDASRIPAGKYKVSFQNEYGYQCSSGLIVTIGRDSDERLLY